MTEKIIVQVERKKEIKGDSLIEFQNISQFIFPIFVLITWIWVECVSVCVWHELCSGGVIWLVLYWLDKQKPDYR